MPKVLIVDDDRYTRRVIETLIARDPEISAMRPAVLLADDRDAGLAAFDRERPDVVVTDLYRPELTGLELCRALRAKSGGLPILAMSALQADPALIEGLKQELGVEFFVKPFQVRDLVRAVREHLIKADARAPEVAPEPVPAGEMSGALAERPLPFLLLDYLEEKATGTLAVQRGRMRKEVVLDGGRPVGVRSNLRRETLSAYLVGRHLIDTHQMDAALAHAQRGAVRFGQSLVELGYMREAEVLAYLAAHVQLKLVNCLRWRDGMWHFEPRGRGEHELKTPLDPVMTVLRGLHRSARADAIALELEPYERLRLIPTPRVDDYGGAFRREFGGEALEALAAQPLVGQLLRQGNPIDLLPALDALVATGMAVLDPPPLTMPAPAPARPRRRSMASMDPLALQNLRRASEPPRSTPRPSSIDELFSEEELREAEPAEITGPRGEVLRAYLGLAGRSHYQLLGLAPGATKAEITAAFDRESARLRRFDSPELEDDRPKLVELLLALRRAYETLVDDAGRREYDRSLETPVQPGAFEAEALFRDGEDLLRAGDAAAAADRFARAVELRADQADFHAMLGWARFRADGEAAAGRARAELEQALQIDPDLVAAHDYLGRITLEVGKLPSDFRQAALHLGRAVDLDPTRREAFEALERAYGALDAWPELERHYRKLIHDLGERERELQAALWKKLALLYADRLGDPKSALFAFDVAATLQPDDASIADRVVELAAQAPEQWPVAARALRAKWRMAGDLAAARRLMELHLQGRRTLSAARVAQAIRAFGATDPEVLSAASQFVSRGLATPRSVDAGVLARVRAPGDDPELGELLVLLGPVARALKPLALEDLGILPQHRVTASAGLSEALGRARDLLGQSRRIELYEHPAGGDDVRAVLVDPPVLAAGPRALASGDLPALKFRAARAASYLLSPGRILAVAWPAKRLRALLVGAALACGRPSADKDHDRDVGRVRARVALEPDTVQRAIRERVERLALDPDRLDVAGLVTAIARTADRIGLLACDDLSVALRALRGDADATWGLLDWALSDEYIEVRDLVYEPTASEATDWRQSPLGAIFEPATDPSGPPAGMADD